MNQASTKKMTPGDDMHLTLLMAPHNLNLVTGQDRQHLLAFGRAAFEAGQKCQGYSVPPNGLHQIAEPGHSMSQYANKDDMLKAVMAENEQLRAQLAAAQPVFSHMELRADGSHGAGRAVAVDAMGREMPSYNPTAAAQQGVQQSIEKDVREIVGLLKNREWAEHIGQTELGRELEHEITKLYNATHPTPQGMDAKAYTMSIERAGGVASVKIPVLQFSNARLQEQLLGAEALGLIQKVDRALAAQAKQGERKP